MQLRRAALVLAASITLAILIPAEAVHADQLLLKNGHEYSGKFVRGDASVVEFRTDGRIESFKTGDVSQIIFKDPELTASSSSALPPVAAADRSLPTTERPIEPQAPTGDRQTPPDIPSGPSITFPSGTSLTVRTVGTIDTDRNQVGDNFSATLEDPLIMGSQVVVPRGADVRGVIGYAQESGRIAGQSVLIVELTELQLNGRKYSVRTSDYTEVGSSRGKRTAAVAGGGAAVGAIIGAIAGGGKGAAVGAATGAAVGTGAQVLTKGQTLKIPAETMLEFKLQSPLTVELP